MADQLFIDEDGDACLSPSGRDMNLVALPARGDDGSILNPKAWQAMVDAYNRAAAAQDPDSEADNEETYQIGLRDGYEKGVQDADLRTGGNGEFVCCVGSDPDERHCPDPAAMLDRMSDRWSNLANPAPQGGKAESVRPLQLLDRADDEAFSWVTNNLCAVRRDNGSMEYGLHAVIRAFQAGKSSANRPPQDRQAEAARDPWKFDGSEAQGGFLVERSDGSGFFINARIDEVRDLVDVWNAHPAPRAAAALRAAAQRLLDGAETGSLAELHHAISARFGLVEGSDRENELFEALLEGLRHTGTRAAPGERT